MDESTKKEIGRAISQGQKNQQTVERIQNWCRNARVVRSGGVGLIEQIYEVPIGHMGIECDHAPIGGIQCWDLEDAAIDFYVRNCERCNKRNPGSGPDIEPLIKAYKEAEKARLQKEAQLKELEAQKKDERKLQLDKLRASSDADTNQVLDLIEAIENDEDGNPEDKMVELARLAPETFSETIIEFLEKQVLEDNDNLAIPALNTLLTLPINPDIKRKLAVRNARGYDPVEISINHLEETAKELSPEEVEAVLRNLTLEAFPIDGLIPPKRKANTKPLLALASYHGELIKETLRKWLGSEEEFLVETALRTIFIIAPEHPALVKSFLREVFGKLLRHKILLPGFSDKTWGIEGLSILRRTAGRLFRVFPGDADATLEHLLKDSDETARSEGARIYRSVLQEERGNSNFILGEAQNIAFKRVLWMAVDITDDTLNNEAMGFFSYVRTELLPVALTHLDAMVGAAATLSNKMKSIGENVVIETPKTGFEEIEKSQKRSLIYGFQGNLVAWAFAASKLRGIDGVKRILAIYTELPETETEMCSSMVGHLNELMDKPEYVNLVLPHLYTAMTSPEPLVRGNAATAIGKVPYELRRDLPELLFEIYLVFLIDPNILVHNSAVHALKIHGFPENLKNQLAGYLINLILVYMNEGVDGNFVVECLKHYVRGCLTDTQLLGKKGRSVVEIISKLNDMDLCEAVRSLGYSLKNTPGFVKICAKCLQGEKTYQMEEEEHIFRLLHHVPRNQISEVADELIDTAKSFTDNRSHLAGQIIVLLAKAGCWAEAIRICEHMLSVIPNTRLNLSIRLYFESLRQVCVFESVRPEEKISIDKAEADWSRLLKDIRKEEADLNSRSSFGSHFPSSTNHDEEHPFHMSFSIRLLALRAIEQGDVETMQEAATKIKDISIMFGRNHPSAELRAFSHLLDCLAFAQLWINAVRDADVNSERFRNACHLRATEALKERAENEPTTLDSVLSDIAEIKTPDSLNDLKRRIMKIPLPFGVWTDEHGINFSVKNTEGEIPKQIEIAFVKFEINGQPAKEIDTLSPNILHDIKIDIRVSHWPDSADQLIVTPVSMEPSDTYKLPTFVIDRPLEGDGNGPHAFNRTGRLLLKVPTAISTNPLEFKYRAVFEPSHSEQPLEILGHRTLRIESHDPSTHTFSGYAEIDSKLRELRNDLRMLPGLPHKDISFALEVCAGLGNLAGQALSDSLFPEGTKEKEFQTEAIKALRSRPSIGENLELHPQTGGGVTDLSFHRIRIELKAVPDGKIETEIDKFVEQTAQYVVSSGKRIGVLCVLDSTKKTAAPPPAESRLRIIKKQIGDRNVLIILLCVEGGLARPSDLSR